MGRWFYGLVAATALAAGGCASPEPAQVQRQGLGDGGVTDLSGGGGGGGGGSGSCVDGGTCTTGNPGDCNMGHVVCSGNVSSCVPDVTVQRCYDGPAGTVNKGTCKAGTQTCIGSLGACQGQVKPAAIDNCFANTDDDCDGTVGNGCPTSLTTGTPRTLTAVGNSAGGSPYSLRCPTGTWVSKTVIYGDNTDSYLSGLDIYCGTPTLAKGATSYSVTVAVSGAPISTTGGTRSSGATTTFDCGTGFSPGWFAPGRSDAGGLDALGLGCAMTSMTLDAANRLGFSMTKAVAGSSTGRNPDGYLSFGIAFEDDCAAGEVLVGYDGRNGTWLDYFAPVCAPLIVNYK